LNAQVRFVLAAWKTGTFVIALHARISFYFWLLWRGERHGGKFLLGVERKVKLVEEGQVFADTFKAF
jgi:hypothetical protein